MQTGVMFRASCLKQIADNILKKSNLDIYTETMHATLLCSVEKYRAINNPTIILPIDLI